MFKLPNEIMQEIVFLLSSAHHAEASFSRVAQCLKLLATLEKLDCSDGATTEPIIEA